MSDFSEMYGGRFYKAEDVQKPFVGVISRVAAERMQDGRSRAVVYFEGREKGVVLNATRYRFVTAAARSKNSDEWVGLRIGVKAGTTDFGGKAVGCIEFVSPPATPAQQTAQVKAELDDVIPW